MPTLKQARVIKDLSENPRKSIRQAMLKAGYSLNTANRPSDMTESIAWKTEMQKYLPDHKLFKTHEEALQATKWNDFTGDREADHSIRLKAVDMAYKLKGRGATDGATSNTQINITLDSSGYIPKDNTLKLKPTKR